MTATESTIEKNKRLLIHGNFLRIALEVIFMVAILAALFWYVGVGSIYNALLHIRVEYLLLAFLMYFGINLLFTVRLRRVPEQKWRKNIVWENIACSICWHVNK